MIKLIAIDMDGTLLNSKKQLLEETKQYFKEFHNKDTETLLVLCTGRPETGIRPYLKDLGYLEENHYIILLAKMALIFTKAKQEIASWMHL